MARARLNARPRPLKSAATRLARILGVAGSLVTALAGWGLISALQQDAVTGLLGAIPGAVTAVTAVLTAFGVVRRAEPLVTPISSPQNNAGQDLVPARTASRPGDFGSGLGADI